VLYYDKKNLSQFIDPDGVRYYEGRGEVGLCLHLPLKDYVAGASPGEDYMLMIAVANDLIEFLLYKRAAKGPEAWDYDPEKAAELYTVCGDNPSIAGIIVLDRNYSGGAKLQLFLDKTFGSNEIAVRWKNQMVGDEHLMDDYATYMRDMLRNEAASADQA
jgi:hypothetical protein